MEIQVHNNAATINKHIITFKKLAVWVCEQLNLPIQNLNIIFTDDQSLYKMHKEFLNDDTYTDVITFNLGTSAAIEGEIYISLDRAEDNASNYNVPLNHEIFRLIIHACLHLYGYEDKIENDRILMKKKEESILMEAINIL